MSQTRINIRTAAPADVGTLLSLISSAFRGEESRKGWTTEADLLAGDRIDEVGLLAKIAEPNCVMLLATDVSGDPVACCELLRRDDEVGHLGLFAVEPRLQGGGLGKQILQIAESYAHKTMSIQRLEMQVIWTRAELIAWYIRRGYVRTGEKRPFPYDQLVSGAVALQEDLHFDVLEKDLTSPKDIASVA